MLEAGIDFAVIEKLLGHRLHGMGEGYIHNWQTRLRDAVTRLEAFVLEKFRQTETQEMSDVGSYGQLPNDGSRKCLISGAEGQNRTVDTSLFRADNKPYNSRTSNRSLMQNVTFQYAVLSKCYMHLGQLEC